MVQTGNPFNWQNMPNIQNNPNPNMFFGMMPPWFFNGMPAGGQGRMPSAPRPQGSIPSAPVKPTPQPMPQHMPQPMPGSFMGVSEADKEALKKRKEENAKVLDPSRYKETNISQSDLSRIVGLYGNDVENIYALSPGQRWMFDMGHSEKKIQIMQFVCRAKVEFDPPSFRQRVYALVQKHENLRTAFAYRSLEQPYKVVLKSRTVNYLLKDSENALEADDEENVNRFINKRLDEDKQRGFDLENDPLVRIMVYKLKDDDYVFILSQPHINTDGSSMGMLIKDLFMDYALELNGIDVPETESSYREYARYMMNVDKEKQLRYWKHKLDGFTGECSLPGHSRSNGEYYESEYVVTIDEDIYKKLNKLQSVYKASLFSILQSAWVIALSRITGRDDILFGTVISGRHSDVKDSMQTLGGFAEMVPLRAKLSENETLTDLVSDLQLALKEAEENSDCTLREIEESIGRETPLISHALNFHNFAMPKVDMFKNGALKGFELVSGSMHISSADDLSLVFSKSEKELLCNFHYNLNSYLPYTVMITGSYYAEVLTAIADAEPDVTIADMPKPDRELFDVAKEAYDLSNLKTVMVLKKKELFKELNFDELVYLVEKSKLVGYVEGSRIFDPEDELDTIPVVLLGVVSVFSVDYFGWNMVSEVLSGNNIITCAALGGEKAGVGATVRANNTQILFIPKEIFTYIMSRHQELAVKLPVLMEKQIRRSYEIGSEEQW